jgi:hypothetical protein
MAGMPALGLLAEQHSTARHGTAQRSTACQAMQSLVPRQHGTVCFG